jgi:uncharacterized protein YbaP (TraB family)
MAPASTIGATAGQPEPALGGNAREHRAARRILPALLLAFALQSGCAAPGPHETQPAPATAAVPEARATPLLWRASGPEPGDGSFFLLGSIHVGRPEGFEVGAGIAEAFATCDELVVEVDLSALSPEEIAEQTARRVLLPEGQTLHEVLSNETYALLEAHLSARGIPVAAVDHLKPWAVSTFLAMLEFEAAGLQGDYGVDRQFLARAAGRRPIRQLETLESQLALLDGLSPGIQEMMLADSLLRMEDAEAESSALVEAWERGDEAALTRLLLGPLEEHPELADFYEAVFFARNESMAEQLAALRGDGKRRFVVLGAGHMLGPRGIPELLAARGFRVERVEGR